MQFPGQFRGIYVNQEGSVTLAFAIAVVTLTGFIALAVDHNVWTSRHSELGDGGDAAALAGAHELVNALLDGDHGHAAVRAEATAANFLRANHAATAQASIVVGTQRPLSVRVDLSERGKKYFSPVVHDGPVTIGTVSEALVADAADACVVALDPMGAPGIEFNLSGEVAAEGCSIWANSETSASLVGKGSGSVSADTICTVGTAQQNGGLQMQPRPRSSCFEVRDPFAEWAPPTYSTVCTATKLVLDKPGIYQLAPGTYCGGIAIKGGAQVTFQPGIYIMKDGPLLVEGGGSIAGSEVSFHLTGAKAAVNLGGASKVELSAPSYGANEGMLFTSARAEAPQISIFRGSNVFSLEGSVYLPTHQVEYAGGPEGTMEASHHSLVAGRVKFNGGSQVRFRMSGDTGAMPKAFTHLYLAR